MLSGLAVDDRTGVNQLVERLYPNLSYSVSNAAKLQLLVSFKDCWGFSCVVEMFWNEITSKRGKAAGRQGKVTCSWKNL